MKYLFHFLMILLANGLQVKAGGSDSIRIHKLLTDIADAQYTSESKHSFHPGMFYSYKICRGYPEIKTPDNNIFFTAITAFSLRNMLPSLNETNRAMAENIIEKAKLAYPFYQNKKGFPSYFFWQDGVPIMVNTLFVSKLSKQVATSEDVDDSVMILMAKGASEEEKNQLKAIMDAVANGKTKWITNTKNAYKKVPAHTTYLGTRMRVDFDFAVHCNILYFLLDQKLPFNAHDSATLNLVAEMVKNREYLADPAYTAPYYIEPSIILYHLSRLVSTFYIPALEPYKEQIINDLKSELRIRKNGMLDVLTCTSLLRLGVYATLEDQYLQELQMEDPTRFVFYEARAASQMANPFKRLLLKAKIFNYRFYSPAYNKVLLLEYLVEKQQFEQKNRSTY